MSPESARSGAGGVPPQLLPVQSPLAQGVSCNFQLEDNRVGARCTYPGPTNTRFRAWAACTNGRVATGPWQYINSGGRSWANCGRNVFLTNWRVDLG